jgi:hypothetical protein
LWELDPNTLLSNGGKVNKKNENEGKGEGSEIIARKQIYIRIMNQKMM